jgi:hypothetical protein
MLAVPVLPSLCILPSFHTVNSLDGLSERARQIEAEKEEIRAR